MTPDQKLKGYLRPPGKGIYAVSSGRTLASQLLKQIYQTASQSGIQRQWQKNLQRIKKARIILIGCPSDNGAGIVRGSNMAPLALRTKLYNIKKFKQWIQTGQLLDIGDIIVIPQLLSDEMLTPFQKQKNRRYLYPKYRDASLAVSPLSILRDVCRMIFALNPNAKIITLGGDHSVSWPLIQSVYQKSKTPFAVLHIDAHTDLLQSRLGIDHCFGTWAYHANDLMGRQQRLVQVGIRASGKIKSHWEKHLDVKQIWAKEILKNPKRAIAEILAHLKSLKLDHLYISNDIDGTGREYASATGTPEPGGPPPQFFSQLIHAVGKHFNVIGSDLVEVAPVLHLNKKGEPQRTLKVGCQYTLDMIEAMLMRP